MPAGFGRDRHHLRPHDDHLAALRRHHERVLGVRGGGHRQLLTLSEIQAQVVLDMQLKRLQGLDREKLQNEYKELEEKIAYFLKVLSDDAPLMTTLHGLR